MDTGDYLAYAGMGLTFYGGVQENKMIAQSAGARAAAQLENAKAYRQNALYEAMNADKRQSAIKRSYKRINERIKATSASHGFRASGELLREAELNERRAVEEMRFGSAMMARNFSEAARRSVQQGRREIQGIKYQQRANIMETGASLLTQGADYYYSK